MSKFIDKLKRVSQAAPQPIGFRRAESVSAKARIQLVVRMAAGDIENLADYAVGADAALVPISKSGPGVEALKKISVAMPDIPWGAWLGDISAGKIKQMVAHGCDFVVFTASSTPIVSPQNDETGKILEVEASLDEGLLRAVNELPVDAVLVAPEQEGSGVLTWYQLMLFQRFADLLTKLLLVSAPPDVTGSELQRLWEAGVDGVVVEAGAGGVKGLRQVIDKLTFQTPRKREKREALLPRIERESGAVAEAEEEEEEEEE